MTVALFCATTSFGDAEKKIRESQHLAEGGHSLEAFHQRLRDLCAHDLECARRDRASVAKDQAQLACAVAREYGILKAPGVPWQDFVGLAEEDAYIGSEHVVDFASHHDRVVKITKPPAFGFTPYLNSRPVVNLRGAPEIPSARKSLEIYAATPLEYLERWIAANEILGDRVELASVIAWSDGQVSFTITQPQYHGEAASPRQIEEYSTDSGWELLHRITDHTVYYNFAYDVLAIDAMPRNCYIHDDALLPFDVILCHPGDVLGKFLQLHPD